MSLGVQNILTSEFRTTVVVVILYGHRKDEALRNYS